MKDDILVPVLESHAKSLYPMITDEITATIQWDGPASYLEYEKGLKQRELSHRINEIYLFTIIDPITNQPAGSIDIRPDSKMFRANIGLWIGEQFHGQGLGTKAIKAITSFGFEKLNLRKIEAFIFKGNIASRRIFEKCGYELEGTIRSAVLKKEKEVDEWLFGKLNK